MRRHRPIGISMRWWLAVAFGSIAALTAVAVAQVFSERSAQALRERSTDLAVGAAVGAADAVSRAFQRDGVDSSLARISDRRRLSLFVFDTRGALMTPARSLRVDLGDVPLRDAAVRAALDGRRFIRDLDDGRATVVALRLRPTTVPTDRRAGVEPSGAREPAVLLAYASRPELVAELGILREKIVEAALIAVAIAAAVGLLVSLLITGRLRKIAAAAAAIEQGSFETRLTPRFRDELGALASAIDGMRERLRDSFSRLSWERDRLQRLLGRLQDGVLTVDAQLRIEFVNDAARALLDTRAIEEGDPLPDPWPGVSLRRLAHGLFAPDAPVAHARAAPDEERALMIVGLPARHDGEAAVLVITDVSERERRERAEREFVTNAAHELRNPLASISSAVDVLESGAKDVPDERDRFIANIRRETTRLARLTRALLVLARAQTRAEPPAFRPVALAPLLEAVAAAAEPQADVDIVTRCAGDLYALAEPDLVEQAVANLVANAAKHTTAGQIVLSATQVDAASVAIEVSDTGPGIAPAEQERVFDRFYRGRRDEEGFGLGLAIVQQAVRALGGRVELASTLGHGTTVRVMLPAAKARAA